MSKLWSLKYAAVEYKKIRMEYKKIQVTDEYTFEEREDIRRWVKIAKTKAITENNDNMGTMKYAWKVRGNPKRECGSSRFVLNNENYD